MKLAPPLVAFTAGALSTASAAVITLSPGPRTDDPVTGVNDWTLDAGFVVDVVPANPNRILFEAGGDGLGTALAFIGSELVVYQDSGDFVASSPGPDSFFTLDISSLAGSVISLRLDADLAGAADTLTLTATDGSITVTNFVTLPSDVGSIAGGNDTGFGVVAADLAGLDESVEPGFPNMAQFQNASYMNSGANTLGADRLAGTLYTGADQPPATLPAPSSWGLVVPEPGPAAFLSLAAGGMLLRRRRP